MNETEIRSVDNIFNTGVGAINTNYEGIATAYSCVRLIANSIASTRLPYLTKDGNEIVNSPITKTIANPYENTTYFTWMSNMVRDLVLHGNGYSLILGNELLYVPYNQVQVYVTNKQDVPFYYRVTSYGKSYNVFPENMVHFKNITKDGIVGISPLLEHKFTFDANASMQDYSRNFVANSSSISGTINTEKKLNKETIAEIGDQFSKRFSGVENAGRVPVLPEGMTFNPIASISPTDMDFINNYKLNKSLIAEIFQVPLSMLGTSDLSYNNAESNALMFQNYTLLPILSNIEQEMTLKLVPKGNSSLKFLVDTLKMTTTKEKSDSLSLLVNTGIFTSNEARRAYGLTSITGGDELINKTVEVAEPKNTDKTNTNGGQLDPQSKR